MLTFRTAQSIARKAARVTKYAAILKLKEDSYKVISSELSIIEELKADNSRVVSVIRATIVEQTDSQKPDTFLCYYKYKTWDLEVRESIPEDMMLELTKIPEYE